MMGGRIELDFADLDFDDIDPPTLPMTPAPLVLEASPPANDDDDDELLDDTSEYDIVPCGPGPDTFRVRRRRPEPR